jgi:hypothetical protein
LFKVKAASSGKLRTAQNSILCKQDKNFLGRRDKIGGN